MLHIRKVRTIKTREKGYRDYGFEPGEEKRLIRYCRSNEFDRNQELLIYSISANETLANDIYYSIVNDISFEDLTKIKYIPASKNDFYAYRRKTLANMRNWLIFHNIKF